MWNEYYPSTKGLKVRHLFPLPVETLCVYPFERLEGKDVSLFRDGEARMIILPPDPVIRAIRFRRIPTPQQPCPMFDGEFEEICQEIFKYYRFTSYIQRLLLTRFQVSKAEFKRLNSKCLLNHLDCLAIDSETAMYQLKHAVELDNKPGLTDLGIVAQQLRSGSAVCILSKAERRQIQDTFRYMEFQRATFDAVCLAYQLIRRHNWATFTHHHRKELKRLKFRIIDEPEVTAYDLKKLAAECRSHYYQDTKITCRFSSLVKNFTKKDCLRFSYLARALPPPLTQKRDEAFHELVDRLTQEPADPDPDWQTWCRFWCENNKPKDLKLHTSPSNAGCIPFTRQDGGHNHGYQSLILYAMGLGKNTLTSKQPPTAYEIPDDNAPIHVSANKVHHRYNRLNDQLSKLLKEGCKEMLRKLEVIPAEIVYADEKGLKVRLPTKTLSCVNLIQQPLRKAADAYLIRDRRIGPSLGHGVMPPRLRHAKGQEWYSLDMTTATDRHPFWLTGGFYSVLTDYHPELKEMSEFYPKIFGPRLLMPEGFVHKFVPFPPDPVVKTTRTLLNADRKPGLYAGLPMTEEYNLTVTPELAQWAYFLTYARGGADKHTQKRFVITNEGLVIGDILAPIEHQNEGGVINVSPEQIMDSIARYACSINEWISTINSLSHGEIIGDHDPLRISRRGAMMGDPTSWAILPLLNLYAWETCVGNHNVTTCGDDLVGQGPQDRNDKIAPFLESRGGQVSLNKTFRHPTKALFTEVPYECGIPQPYDLLSAWVSPPGGTKGSTDWYSLPLSVLPRQCASGGLWKYTKHKRYWSLANKLGLPLAAEPVMGGIRHPKWPTSALRRRTEWLSWVSGMSLKQLLFKGGLSIIPPAESRRISKFEETCYEIIIKNLVPTGTPGSTPVEDVRKQVQQSETILRTLQGRNPVPDYKSPSVFRAARRFESKILSRPPVLGSYKWNYLDTLITTESKRHRNTTALKDLSFMRLFAWGDPSAKALATVPGVPLSMSDSLLVVNF